ncbi:hypothetical protein P872_08640 [Rhodonellum psychrophilum GCM71 = DSM 17998]|uniref:Uncharacterized protein n=1 Tax=Rhodonellum psychrophilum GCM71 = DSM 17998 TaxID=1123057 RepID=U5BZE1_9BACT|nr:hypothetical protein P872_08640 [Rhodonellum psychrophilum GCM71 = DSM 17998]
MLDRPALLDGSSLLYGSSLHLEIRLYIFYKGVLFKRPYFLIGQVSSETNIAEDKFIFDLNPITLGKFIDLVKK